MIGGGVLVAQAERRSNVSGEVGHRIRNLRAQRGMSQAQLAGEVGMSGSYLSLIESGRRAVPPEFLQKLAAKLDCPVTYLEIGRGGTDDDSLELDLRFAELALRSGDAREGEKRFVDVLTEARARKWRDMELDARWGLGRAREMQGLLEAAIDNYEELAAESVLPASVGRLKLATALSRAYSECGDLGRAIEVAESAVAAARSNSSIDAKGDDAVALTSTLVGCYYERGDLTRAHALARTALAAAESGGSPLARAAALWNASLVVEARGDLRTARVYADRALALYSESDNERAVALLRVVTAWLLLREPDPPLHDAERLLDRALTALEAVGSPVDTAYAETELARCRLLSGDWEDAIRIAEGSLAHLGESPRIEAARARLLIGHARLMGGDTEGAVAAYGQAGADLRDFGAQRQAASAWRELAESLVRLGRTEQAIEAYRNAADAAGVSKAPEQAVISHAAVGRT